MDPTQIFDDSEAYSGFLRGPEIDLLMALDEITSIFAKSRTWELIRKDLKSGGADGSSLATSGGGRVYTSYHEWFHGGWIRTDVSATTTKGTLQVILTSGESDADIIVGESTFCDAADLLRGQLLLMLN
jgi:hypothetical protein